MKGPWNMKRNCQRRLTWRQMRYPQSEGAAKSSFHSLGVTKCQARATRTQGTLLTAPDAVHQIAGGEVSSLLSDMRWG